MWFLEDDMETSACAKQNATTWVFAKPKGEFILSPIYRNATGSQFFSYPIHYTVFVTFKALFGLWPGCLEGLPSTTWTYLALTTFWRGSSVTVILSMAEVQPVGTRQVLLRWHYFCGTPTQGGLPGSIPAFLLETIKLSRQPFKLSFSDLYGRM